VDGDWGRGRPIAALAERGMLGPTMTFVHCNALADDELSMMADAGCTASISPDIELQMGTAGRQRAGLLRAGIRPSLSIDVCASNGGHMFGTMRATIGTQRGFDNADALQRGESLQQLELTCRQVLEFATIEGARACGIDHKVGSLTPGKRADIVLLRTDDLGMTPMNNPIGAVVYNAQPGARRHDPRRRNGRQARRATRRRGRGARAPAGERVARRHPPPRWGRNGARIGGDWIPASYEPQPAEV